MNFLDRLKHGAGIINLYATMNPRGVSSGRFSALVWHEKNKNKKIMNKRATDDFWEEKQKYNDPNIFHV